MRPLKTAEELREANCKAQRRFYQRRKEIAELYSQFPLLEDDFIKAISERVIEDGKPKRVIRLALLLDWARKSGTIR